MSLHIVSGKVCCELDNLVFPWRPVPKAIGTRPKWIVFADTDKMNNSVAIWHPNIYVVLCINQRNIALNVFVNNGRQMAQENAFGKQLTGQ